MGATRTGKCKLAKANRTRLAGTRLGLETERTVEMEKPPLLQRRKPGPFVFLWATVGLVCVTLLLLAGAAASKESEQWVNHTLQVLEALERYEAGLLLADLRSRDTASITARTEAAKGMRQAKQALQTLTNMVQDNSEQAVRVKVLANMTEEANGLLVGRMRPIGSQEQELQARFLPMSVLVAETLGAFRREERKLLELRQAKRAAAERFFGIATAVAILGNLLLLGWAYWAGRNYERERSANEAEVRQLNAQLGQQNEQYRQLNLQLERLNTELEDRVQQKTEQLEDSVQRLRNSNAELERFAYVASHDLQEPLRQIVSFNNLLAARFPESLDPKAKDYLANSIAGAKRLQSMLRGLLQYTLVASSPVSPSWISAHQVTDEALLRLQPELAATGGVIRLQSGKELDLWGDREKVRLVLEALFANVLRFRRPGVPPVADLWFAKEEGFWTAKLTDNGIGIPTDFAEKMFTMFSRAHSVGRYDGGGAGLAICRKIAEAHGGIIKAMPHGEGLAGCTVVVQMPCPPKPTAASDLRENTASEQSVPTTVSTTNPHAAASLLAKASSEGAVKAAAMPAATLPVEPEKDSY